MLAQPRLLSLFLEPVLWLPGPGPPQFPHVPPELGSTGPHIPT